MPNDLDKLQGTWYITSLEADGVKMPAAAFTNAKIVIKGDKFKSLGMGAKYEGLVEVDRTQTPKALDLVFTVGHAAGTRNLGIYKLSKDRWTLCLATRGTRRPKTFGTKPGTGLALETLERSAVLSKGKGQKAKPAPARSTKSAAKHDKAQSGEVTELEGEWSMVAGVFNGAAMQKSMLKWAQRITRGSVTRVVAGPQVILNASFALDQSLQPHWIDYQNIEGANAGKSQAGIFERSGDSLKICMATPGRPRPTDFSSKRGDGRSFTTWRLIAK